MKLIYHLSLILWFTKTVFPQKFTQDQYPFPPQFKPPNSGVFGSDSSIYLPAESHTTVPYFSLNNGNKLPYQFLPPTANKIPALYPTPFPMIMSSTMMSRRNEEDDDEEEEIHKKRIPQVPSYQRININQTVKHNEHSQEKDTGPMPKMFNNPQNQIDRNDIKFPQTFHAVSQKPPVNQEPTSQRRMIISNEVLNNDHISNQVKRASILGPQLLSSPVIYYSTTEPAIPILRLSNEMDLDGSFSYEALGADQTHYVQHSRMENSGTDKEEQVVEGSYSYVGDNGQTYTVHYVADSNGYRASGDHLPVPPPIPEIIQRAVQYNLAEEARKPPHLKTWQDNENEQSENEKQRFSVPPPRNLFTGRTPEAFSFGSPQTSLLQNNIPAADNSHNPVKTNSDYSFNQSKSKVNNGPIAPQITFLASQGAHNPTVPSAQQQISRIFATEKPSLPQIMNYEAGSSESDQENNKALWRWQYGINANAANENHNPNKNSISRSFGEGDDVIINFNEMSPEQYTKLMKNEFMEQNTEMAMVQREPYNKENNAEPVNYVQQQKNDFKTSMEQNENMNNSSLNEQYGSVSTENTAPYFFSTTINKDTEYNQYLRKDPEVYSNSNTYFTSTPLAPQLQDQDNLFESTKINSQNFYTTTDSPNAFIVKNNQNMEKNAINSLQSNTEKLNNDPLVSSSNVIDEVKNIKFTDFIQKEEKSDFKPITYANIDKENSQDTTTADPSPENIIRENIFLKNLFKPDNINQNRKSEKIEEPQKPTYNKINSEINKAPKFIQYQSKPQNEIKNNVKKPLDITDVLNYMTFKNYFESNKLNSKNKFSSPGKYSQRFERPQIFIPLEDDRDQEEEQMDQEESHNLRPYNNQKQQELRGVIKNYKVLQRNNNIRSMGQNRDQFLTDASSRHLKTMQTQNLPPLGRAGPSTKSYLPPTYV